MMWFFSALWMLLRFLFTCIFKQFDFDMPLCNFLHIWYLRFIWLLKSCGLCFHLISKSNLATTIFPISTLPLSFGDLNYMYIRSFWPPDVKNWFIGKRPWCWERLKMGGKGDDRGWDCWMASLTQWTWVWASPRSWWWTAKPGVQRVKCNWALNWKNWQCHTGRKDKLLFFLDLSQ